MELIKNKPYRISVILSNSTERDLEKQKAKIKVYMKVRQEIKSDFDFQILGSIARMEVSLNNSFSNVEQNQNKFKYPQLLREIEDSG